MTLCPPPASWPNRIMTFSHPDHRGFGLEELPLPLPLPPPPPPKACLFCLLLWPLTKPAQEKGSFQSGRRRTATAGDLGGSCCRRRA